MQQDKQQTINATHKHNTRKISLTCHNSILPQISPLTKVPCKEASELQRLPKGNLWSFAVTTKMLKAVDVTLVVAIFDSFITSDFSKSIHFHTADTI